MNDIAVKSPPLDEFGHAQQTNQHRTDTQMARVLGLPSLLLFGLAYMVPLTVFTTYGIVTQTTGGHLPAAYAVTLVTMLFTAYSYGRMGAALPVAGSAYAYARKAFGGNVGFMVGWALLLDYLFMPMICYLVIGIYMAQYFPGVPQPVWIVGCIAAVLALNVLGIKLVTKANFALIGVQVVFIAVFVVASVKSVAASAPVSYVSPFYEHGMNTSGLFMGAATLCLSFLGFDAVSTLSEETRDPQRLLPKAIILCTLVSGLLFIFLAYLSQLALPDWKSFKDADSASLELMEHVGGHLLSAFFTAVYVAGCFACAMASQASVTRILFAMGRDGVLPRSIFGRRSVRFGTPVSATVAVSLLSLSALAISLDLASTMISFGALVAFSFVNLSMTRHHLGTLRLRGAGNLLRYGVVPIVGFLLTVWLWTSLSATTFRVGLIWLAVGLCQLLWLTRGFRRPAPRIEEYEEANACF
jgi:amino acid transporter